MASLAVGDTVRVRDKVDAGVILGLDPEGVYFVEAVEVIRDKEDIPVLRLKGISGPMNTTYFERI